MKTVRHGCESAALGFGDTLVDEQWMRHVPAACPSWEDVWIEVMSTLADPWNVGAVTSAKVFAELARRAGMTATEVAAHARVCCEQLAFRPTAWRVARERRLPQALVTVNPDLLTDIIVPAYGMGDVFDIIVTSAAEATADKTELCLRARARLGVNTLTERVPCSSITARTGWWVADSRRLGLLVPRRRTVREGPTKPPSVSSSQTRQQSLWSRLDACRRGHSYGRSKSPALGTVAPALSVR